MLAELIIIYVFIFIMGAVLGSFFNVCISRIPQKESLMPASHCPNCGSKIKPYHNIPILSYLILRGKCRSCRQPISFSYFLVELLTPLLFILIFYVANSTFSLLFFRYIVFASFGIVIAFIDFKQQIIPDLLSLPLIGLGLLFGWLESGTAGLVQAALGGAFGFMLFLLTAIFYTKVRKIEALGGGDIKLMAALGTFAGWAGVLAITFLASLLALIVLLLLQHDYKKHFPFGPFLITAALFYLIAGRQLVNLYLKLFI
ncbi:MAG: prepilin peptidase [Candidatus Cloacimonadales bacterium]